MSMDTSEVVNVREAKTHLVGPEFFEPLRCM